MWYWASAWREEAGVLRSRLPKIPARFFGRKQAQSVLKDDTNVPSIVGGSSGQDSDLCERAGYGPTVGFAYQFVAVCLGCIGPLFRIEKSFDLLAGIFPTGTAVQ